METAPEGPMEPAPNACPHCGGALPAGDLAGLCPACLLRQGAICETGLPETLAPPALEELAELFPQLEILSMIGTGGMGAVYKARQRELDRLVALKILPPGIGDRPGFAERFTREAKALARLSHSGIVTIHDTGRVHGLYYLLMEYVDGLNLRQLMQTGRITPHEALAIVPQICDALQYSHDAGVVHRDIKPENILLDRQGRVKVADFGIAKLVGTEETGPGQPPETASCFTQAGHVMGTPQYMAPEQIEHPGDVDHRADIYSLGVVLYQMLTGELPGGSLDPPSRKVQIDVRLDEVVLRALEKNPEHRYQQASQFKQIVETITIPIENQPKETPAMDIEFNCPKCHQKLSVDPSAAGATVQCPTCAEPMVIPSPSQATGFSAPAPQMRAPARPSGPKFVPPASQFVPPAPAVMPKRAKGLAIAALVLGIVGIIPIIGLATGVFALALGIVALVKKTTSKGMAIAGTVLGALAMLMIPVHLALLTAAMTGAKFGTRTVVCTNNLKLIGTAITEYQQKHDGRYPDSLNTLEKEGLISANSLRCPMHEKKSGQSDYEYSRPNGTEAQGILAWDRFPHRAGNVVIGRNVLDSDLSVRLMTEQQFQQAPRAASQGGKPVSRPQPPVAPPTRITDKPSSTPRPQPRPQPQPEPPPVEKMTVSSAITALKSASAREQRAPLDFLAKAPVVPEQRIEVIAAVKPLLNDVDSGPMAFEAFAQWADKEQVPDLIEMMRVAPNSPKGKQCMKLLSRMGDARAAEPLAACLTEFFVQRDAKAALAALGDIAKPAVLPYYHHEDRNTRESARELLRGYNITEEETFAESIKILEKGSSGARQSAIFDLSKAKLTPAQQATAARAIRPLLTDNERRVQDAARNAMKTLATSADADFLLEQMNSTDDPTRQFATDLLVSMKEPRAAKAIAALLGDSRKTHAAGRSLISLGSAAEPAVIPYLRSDDPPTRKRAAEVLAEIGTSASLSALQPLERDKDFFTKTAATRAIAAIKSRQPAKPGQR